MISHFTLLTWRIQGIRHGGRAASYVTSFISKGWRSVIRVVVCGDQATSFGQCTVLPFPTISFLGGFWPYMQLPGGCCGPWGMEYRLDLPICGELSAEDPACCLLPLLFICRMEITQAFANTFQGHALPLLQEDGTFVKGRTCHHMQKKGLYGNERDYGLWSCPPNQLCF